MVVAKRVLWLDPPQELLEDRRRKGLDRFDEVWDGVLHMVPPPAFEHSTIQHDLETILNELIQRRGLGKARPQVGVRPSGSGISNYRVPDITVLSPKRYSMVADGWVNGGPDLVIEVRSPGDETYEKFSFYASLAVDEILVVDRDSKQPELYRLAGKEYHAVSSDADGWLALKTFPIALRLGREAKLEVQDRAAPERTIHILPGD
jgi:Uma2 family endonuclease